MKHNFIFKSLMSGFGMLVLLSACDDEIDPAVEHERYVQEQKEAFAETFTEMFGEIPADQSWDFSVYGNGSLTRSTRGVITDHMSDPVGDPSTGAEWMTFGWGDPLQKLLNESLTEKNPATKNLGQGNVYFVVPNTKFTIYPVMQGLAVNWDLYMQVGNMEPELIWKKSHNIKAWNGAGDGYYRPLGLAQNGSEFSAFPGLYDQLTANIEWSSDITNPSSYYDYQYVYGSSGYNEYMFWMNYNGTKRYVQMTDNYNKFYFYDDTNKTSHDVRYENGNKYYVEGSNKYPISEGREDIDLGWKTSCFSAADMQTVSGIQTKGYTFDLRQYAGQPVTFFLKINARSKYWKNVSLGSKMSSTTNQMRFFDESVFPSYGLDFSHLKSLGSKYMLIGIEDADYHLNSSNQLVEGPNDKLVYDNGQTITFSDQDKNNGYKGAWALSDYDYNDLVLLIISDEIKTVTDEYDEPEITKKRYMVEDLGTTDDIDFNDMVVDIEQTKWFHYKVEKENGEVKSIDKTPSTDKPTIQKATIRAMGGTLDFDFKIGSNVVFKKSTSTYNSNSFTVGTMYNTEKNNINYDKVMWEGTVSGWNPSTNNVSFTVYNKNSPGNGSSDGVGTSSYNVVFPGLGEVPYIIAFDPSKEWRDERHPICKDWLAGKEPAQWEWPEPHNQNGDMTYEEWIKQNPKSN